MLAGGAGWTIANAVLDARSQTDDPQPLWASVALLVSYACVAVALALLTRRPNSRTENLIDGTILGLAALAVTWTCVLRPLTGSDWLLPPATMIALGHASAAAVLVFAVLRLTTLESTPSAASSLLIVAALCLALADVTTVVPTPETERLMTLGVIAGQVWAIALGAAALHPAAFLLRSAPNAPQPAISGQRFSTFVALSVIAPVVPVGIVLAATQPGQRPEVAEYLPGVVAAIAVCCLTVVRLGLVGRVSDAQARDLRRSLRQRAALERELRHRATHDPLTGLANRAVLLDRLDRILADPGHHRSGTLTIIDLDGFKDVNDTLGHAAGDEVLLQVAARLRAAIAKDDLVARFGGDEFALLCASGADPGARGGPPWTR